LLFQISIKDFVKLKYIYVYGQHLLTNKKLSLQGDSFFV